MKTHSHVEKSIHRKALRANNEQEMIQRDTKAEKTAYNHTRIRRKERGGRGRSRKS